MGYEIKYDFIKFLLSQYSKLTKTVEIDKLLDLMEKVEKMNDEQVNELYD